MDHKTWDCCRTCLGVQNLYPLFTYPEHHDIYSNILFTTTGLKIEINDNLPQQICSACLSFINNSVRFRRNCEETNALLLSRLNDNQFCTVKIEPSPIIQIKAEESTKIDISHLLTDLDNDFRDYEDNIALENLKYYETKMVTVELENAPQSIIKTAPKYENCTETMHSDFDSSNVEQKKADSKKKRKAQIKNENGSKVRKERGKSKKENEKKEVECEHCHKILTSKLSLRNHYKIHTGFDVVCEHCGKKFITRRLLLMHCRAKHGYEKTDKCSYCDYKASNAEQVKIHERLHTGEKPYACGQCNAAFHRKSSYLQHIAIHLPEKTVQCDQCPARFKSVTLMRIHKNRHRASNYSFKCRVCEGSFARRRNVARHLLRVHNLQPDPNNIDRRKIG